MMRRSKVRPHPGIRDSTSAEDFALSYTIAEDIVMSPEWTQRHHGRVVPGRLPAASESPVRS